MDIVTHKPALYAAALCTIVPLMMGAKDTAPNSAMSSDPQPVFTRYKTESRAFSRDSRSEVDLNFTADHLELGPTRTPNVFAPCDLIATLPSGEVFCFLIRW